MTRAKLDCLDRRGPLVLAARSARSALLDQRARRECREKRVKRGHLDRKDPRARAAKRDC